MVPRNSRWGAGRTHLLLALVIWPLITHPFRDGVRGHGVADSSGERAWGMARENLWPHKDYLQQYVLTGRQQCALSPPLDNYTPLELLRRVKRGVGQTACVCRSGMYGAIAK